MVKVADETMAYRVPPEERGYYELSSAIISFAVDDYRRLRRGTPTRELKRLRDFFLSDVFENLSGVENPSLFLIRLDEQIDEEIRREKEDGVTRKRRKQTMKCNG